MTFADRKRKANRTVRKEQYVYIVHAYSVWDCDGRGERLTECKTFPGTDDGWKDAESYTRKFADQFWNVTIVKSRKE